jgi:hypothetical protein
MRFHEPDVREGYRRGARECFEAITNAVLAASSVSNTSRCSRTTLLNSAMRASKSIGNAPPFYPSDRQPIRFKVLGKPLS